VIHKIPSITIDRFPTRNAQRLTSRAAIGGRVEGNVESVDRLNISHSLGALLFGVIYG